MRDIAIYNTHPTVVSINDSGIAKDKNNKKVVLDTVLVDAELARLKLEAERTKAIAAVEKEFFILSEADITYNGTAFQADSDSQAKIDKVINRLNAGWVPPTGFSWVASDDTTHLVNLSLLNGIANEIAARDSQLFMRLFTAKTAIRAASTISSIQSVVL